MREIKAIVGIVLVLAVAFIAPAMAQQNNVISIGDVQAAPGESITAPILINTATGIAGIKINLSYNPTIVNVTDYTLGDFNDMDNTDISNAQDGYVVIWVIEWSPQSGDKTVANVELTAVGSAYDTSDLNISILSLKDDGGLEVADRSTENGTFTILNGPGPTPTPTPSPTPTPTPGGSGGGGGGGGGGFTIIQTPTPTPTANNTLNGSDSDCGDSGTCRLTNEAPENIVLTEVTSLNVSKGKNISFCFKEPGNDVVRINYTAKTNAGNINTTVEILKNTSSSVNVHVHAPEPDNVYLYFNVWVGPCGYATAQNIENTSTSIVFRVNKTWIRNNDLDPTKTRITLNRYGYYNKSWNVLPTIKIRDDQSYLYFRASPQSFGSFAITATAPKLKLVQKMPAQTQTPTPTPTEPTITETTTETENKLISIPRFYAIFGLVGLLIIAYRFRRKPS